MAVSTKYPTLSYLSKQYRKTAANQIRYIVIFGSSIPMIKLQSQSILIIAAMLTTFSFFIFSKPVLPSFINISSTSVYSFSLLFKVLILYPAFVRKVSATIRSTFSVYRCQ